MERRRGCVLLWEEGGARWREGDTSACPRPAGRSLCVAMGGGWGEVEGRRGYVLLWEEGGVRWREGGLCVAMGGSVCGCGS